MSALLGVGKRPDGVSRSVWQFQVSQQPIRLFGRQERARWDRYSSYAALLSERQDTHVIENVQKNVASFVDGIEADDVRRVENSLPKVGEIWAAQERHRNDEDDDAARFCETERLLQEERIEIHVAIRDDGSEIVEDLFRGPEYSTVGRISDDGVEERFR